LKKLLNKLKF